MRRLYDIRFDQSIKYGEDILFFLNVMKRMQIFYLRTPLIVYRDESHAQQEFANYKRNPEEVFLTAIESKREHFNITYLAYLKALLPWYTYGQNYWREDFGQYKDRLILRIVSVIYKCLR